MATKINTLGSLPAVPILTFSWAPQTVTSISATIAGNSYTWTNIGKVTAGTNITFTASASLATGVKVIEYTWNFGDGFVTNGPVAVHAFANYTSKPSYYSQR